MGADLTSDRKVGFVLNLFIFLFPYEISVPGTFANIINSFFGSGVLGLPYAFKMSGWLAGTGKILPSFINDFVTIFNIIHFVVTLIAIALISRFCMELLILCRNHILDKDSKEEEELTKSQGSYGDIGEEAFGINGKRVVDCALCFTQTGFCCVYMIFLGNNLNSVFPHISVTK